MSNATRLTLPENTAPLAAVSLRTHENATCRAALRTRDVPQGVEVPVESKQVRVRV